VAPRRDLTRRGPRLVAGLLAVVLAACAADAPTPTPRPTPTPSEAGTPSATADPASPLVEPAPGSESTVYAPNPGAIVVAIDAGHGGCLDWGVPDPSERGVALAEKALTLGIARRLRDLLEADGIGVLMIRDADVALAGDDYPDLGCEGPPWRDVDGDGEAGFEQSGRIRTRDELQARIDLANLARADAFVSIHINSLTQDGVAFEIAATQTFYDDESPWGAQRSALLATGLQDGVVAALDPLATYDRQDRGTEAVAFYAISRPWRDGDECETPGDTWCKPHRALAMPGALSEVGSINLRDEHDLLASPGGQDAVAAGLFDGLSGFFASRDLAARIAPEGEMPGAAPEPIPGDGPPYWPAPAPDGPVRLRLTNTGTEAWPAGVELVAGWEETELPYLAAAPGDLEPLAVEVPDLGPGESVVLEVLLPAAASGRSVAWITLRSGGVPLSDVGSPPLQLSTGAD
jgi:N-acetylmuramoyl-L-alanine amidase